MDYEMRLLAALSKMSIDELGLMLKFVEYLVKHGK
ncbi:hypothetical protein ES703_105615 [subsurface metagenome]